MFRINANIAVIATRNDLSLHRDVYIFRGLSIIDIYSHNV